MITSLVYKNEDLNVEIECYSLEEYIETKLSFEPCLNIEEIIHDFMEAHTKTPRLVK